MKQAEDRLLRSDLMDRQRLLRGLKNQLAHIKAWDDELEPTLEDLEFLRDHVLNQVHGLETLTREYERMIHEAHN